MSLDTTSNPLDTYERPFTVFWRRARANRLARAGSIILMVVICAAVFGPMITPYDPQDMDFMARRQLLGIRNNTMLSDDSYCVHQYHTSPRNLSDSKGILVQYRTREDCILNNL